MADRPILFSSPMVKALLAGTKTQTRRSLNPQPYPLEGRPGFWNASGAVGGRICISDRALLDLHRKPAAGDKLWVKEALQAGSNDQGYRWITYAADNSLPIGGAILWDWKRDTLSPMFMPRWASRITLLVDDVKVERLQDISEDDAIAEGVVKGTASFDYDVGTVEKDWWRVPGFEDTGTGISAVDMYASLWEHINGEGAWDQNPWIVCYRFRVVLENIDYIGGQSNG
jgi:hypothetical protein